MTKRIQDIITYFKIKSCEKKALKYELSEYDKNLIHLTLSYEYLLIGAKKDFIKHINQIYMIFFNGLLNKFKGKQKHIVVLIVVLEELMKIKKFRENLYIKDIINTIKEDPTLFVVDENLFTPEYIRSYRNLFLDEYIRENKITINIQN